MVEKRECCNVYFCPDVNPSVMEFFTFPVPFYFLFSLVKLRFWKKTINFKEKWIDECVCERRRGADCGGGRWSVDGGVRWGGQKSRSCWSFFVCVMR